MGKTCGLVCGAIALGAACLGAYAGYKVGTDPKLRFEMEYKLRQAQEGIDRAKKEIVKNAKNKTLFKRK